MGSITRSLNFTSKMLGNSYRAQEEEEVLIKIIPTPLLIVMILLLTMLEVKVQLANFNLLSVLSHIAIKNQAKRRHSNLTLISSSWNSQGKANSFDRFKGKKILNNRTDVSPKQSLQIQMWNSLSYKTAPPRFYLWGQFPKTILINACIISLETSEM